MSIHRFRASTFKLLIPLLVAVLILTPFAADSAYASDEPPTTEDVAAHQLACEDGACSFHLDMGSETPSWLPAT